MITENIQVLVACRLEQADESLDAARVLLEKRLDRPAINRAYYAMFYAVLALWRALISDIQVLIVCCITPNFCARAVSVHLHSGSNPN